MGIDAIGCSAAIESGFRKEVADGPCKPYCPASSLLCVTYIQPTNAQCQIVAIFAPCSAIASPIRHGHPHAEAPPPVHPFASLFREFLLFVLDSLAMLIDSPSRDALFHRG